MASDLQFAMIQLKLGNGKRLDVVIIGWVARLSIRIMIMVIRHSQQQPLPLPLNQNLKAKGKDYRPFVAYIIGISFVFISSRSYVH